MLLLPKETGSEKRHTEQDVGITVPITEGWAEH